MVVIGSTYVGRNLPLLVLDGFMGNSWESGCDSVHVAESFIYHSILEDHLSIKWHEKKNALIGTALTK